MKKLKQQNAITLVALVITIIILLILAAISIQALTNQGLFGRANEAKRESEIANIKEQIALDIYEKQLEPPVGSITKEQLKTILEKQGTIIYEEDGVTIKGITTDKGDEILLKDIYGGETVAESVPDGATVTPVNDITTWLKTGEISKQYSYTTIEQVIADSTCVESLMNNENAMKYLARSTEFANAICASETGMTYLGDSVYVDDTVLNSDIWVEKICDSSYISNIYNDLIPEMISDTTPSGVCSAYCVKSVSGGAYLFFDKRTDTSWDTNYGGNSHSVDIGQFYIGYDFPNNELPKVLYLWISDTYLFKTPTSMCVEYYDEINSKWINVKTFSLSDYGFSMESATVNKALYVPLNNSISAKKWRLRALSKDSSITNFKLEFKEVSFYGRYCTKLLRSSNGINE